MSSSFGGYLFKFIIVHKRVLSFGRVCILTLHLESPASGSNLILGSGWR